MKQQTGGADLFKQGHDPLVQLQNNFSDMGITKDSQGVCYHGFYFIFLISIIWSLSYLSCYDMTENVENDIPFKLPTTQEIKRS